MSLIKQSIKFSQYKPLLLKTTINEISDNGALQSRREIAGDKLRRGLGWPERETRRTSVSNKTDARHLDKGKNGRRQGHPFVNLILEREKDNLRNPHFFCCIRRSFRQTRPAIEIYSIEKPAIISDNPQRHPPGVSTIFVCLNPRFLELHSMTIK